MGSRAAVCAIIFGSALMAGPVSAETLSPAAMEEATKIIKDSERQWVEAVVTGKTGDLARFMGDDVIGVDSEGRMYDKKTFLAEIQEAPKYFSSNKLNDVNVRFFGPTTAVAQGDESFEMRDAKKGRFVFTDTWVLRDGTWQVVATAAIMAPEK